jgi:hypothetical protein
MAELLNQMIARAFKAHSCIFCQNRVMFSGECSNGVGSSMEKHEIGKLSYEVSPDALKRIVESGRLLEFANTVAASAAAEIHAQIVDQISQAAVGGGSVSSGISVGAVNVFEGGDFGTVPIGPKGPRPKVGVLFGGTSLSHVVDIAAVSQIAR